MFALVSLLKLAHTPVLSSLHELSAIIQVGLHSNLKMYRHQRHSVSDIKAHLICVTKYRKPVLDEAGLELIEQSFRGVAEKMDFQILEFNGEADHVHVLVEYPPKLPISQIVNSLKGLSSRRYGQAGYKKPHKESLWSPSYFAVSVGGAPLEVLKEYIKNQSRPGRAGLESQ